MALSGEPERANIRDFNGYSPQELWTHTASPPFGHLAPSCKHTHTHIVYTGNCVWLHMPLGGLVQGYVPFTSPSLCLDKDIPPPTHKITKSRMLTRQTQRERSDMDSRHLSLILSVVRQRQRESQQQYSCLIRIGSFSVSLTVFNGDRHKPFDSRVSHLHCFPSSLTRNSSQHVCPPSTGKGGKSTHAAFHPLKRSLLPELHVLPNTRLDYHLFHQACIQSALVCEKRFKSDYLKVSSSCYGIVWSCSCFMPVICRCYLSPSKATLCIQIWRYWISIFFFLSQKTFSIGH